jgi:MerR family transcriptional regulator, light-induced transcriptional regulator
MVGPDSSLLRIGAFSQKVGLSAAVLRAWEARYGLFSPMRTAGGYRLYGAEEATRVRRMRANLARGLAPAESAQLVLAERRRPGPGRDLVSAWQLLDTATAQELLDAVLAGPEPDVAAAGLLPLLDVLPPERRHVASRMVETRLLTLAARWHEGPGRLALVGCGAGDHDTLPLIVCGLALHRRGWRIVYLGADTPERAFTSAAAALEPDAVVTGPLEDPLATARQTGGS